MGQTDRHSMRKVMKFLLAFTFVATIQAYHPGYYQPHGLYPQFYQTFPNIRISKPFTEHEIESPQRNDCKNNIGEVVPCYKSFAEKVDQSRIKPVFKRPNNPLFYSISQDEALPSVEDIEKVCQSFQWTLYDIDSLRKFAEFWDGINDSDYYGRKMFGQYPNEEDLIFRKLTGIDEFFDRDFNAEKWYSIVADLKDICANPSAEDAGANFLNGAAKFGDFLQVTSVEIYNEKVVNYMENVCGWEGTQYSNLKDFPRIDINGLLNIRTMLIVIKDIQENSKDWKCANRVTNYLTGVIDIMITTNENFPSDCSTKN